MFLLGGGGEREGGCDPGCAEGRQSQTETAAGAALERCNRTWSEMRTGVREVAFSVNTL